ncbi:MAG: translation initiation factor IF-2, partial [Winogradskyella sp.]|nr:translation initiation factor IF-2 [Winogradskyella sp.]
MAETIRLNKVLRELNISLDRAVEYLDSKGIEIEKRPTTKISDEVYQVLSDEFQTDANKKMASQEVSEAKQKEKEALKEQREREIEEKEKARAKREAAAKEAEVVKAKSTLSGPKQVGKIDLEPHKKVAET